MKPYRKEELQQALEEALDELALTSASVLELPRGPVMKTVCGFIHDG